MAITIQQQPTSPNMSNNDLLWVLTSNEIAEPQYQYVADMFESGSATLIQRVKQQPNPSGKGVFNFGNILTTQLDSDNVWKTQYLSTSSQANKDFVIKFGEEYGTSVSSSVILYNGIVNSNTASVAPAKTGSAFYTITDGLVDYPNAIEGFNFNSSSFYTEEVASTTATFNYQHNLSNAPTTQVVRESDYMTLAFYNGNMDNNPTEAQDIFYFNIDWYDATGTLIISNNFYNIVANGGGPRTLTGTLWGDISVYGGQDNGTRLINVGIGIPNLANAGIPTPAGWAYYTLTVNSQDDGGIDNSGGVWAEMTFVKDTNPYCEYQGVRFTWKNEFGVWDYYTFKLQSDASDSIERIGYEKTNVPYNTTSNSALFNVSNRGSKQFVNKVKRRQNADSDWLNQAEADWLRELFFSTNVFIQDGENFEPVVITSSNLVEKRNPRTQKVFQYQIEFEQANNKRNRL